MPPRCGFLRDGPQKLAPASVKSSVNTRILLGFLQGMNFAQRK